MRSIGRILCRSLCSIGKRAIDKKGGGTIYIGHRDEALVKSVGVTVADKPLDIIAVIVLVTTTRVIRIATADDRKILVLVGRVIVEAVRARVGVVVGAIEPYCWPDSKRRGTNDK
jgi:hypothetical protein